MKHLAILLAIGLIGCSRNDNIYQAAQNKTFGERQLEQRKAAAKRDRRKAWTLRCGLGLDFEGRKANEFGVAPIDGFLQGAHVVCPGDGLAVDGIGGLRAGAQIG